VTLLHDVARNHVHFLISDVLAIDFCDGIFADTSTANVIENSARNKRNDHHDADDGEEADQKRFLKSARGLQESNHLPLGSEKKGEYRIINQWLPAQWRSLPFEARNAPFGPAFFPCPSSHVL
jgi:hypothetical protein